MKKRSSKCAGKVNRSARFVEIFRTTPPKTVCPNFYVLAHANGCSFSPLCSYCYLKSSFWYLAGPRVYTNTAKMLRELSRWIATDNLESYVMNTGNLSDSLTFEKGRPLMTALVELFRTEAEERNRPHSLLIVTKGGTELCRSLLALKPTKNVIISFSVNSAAAARKYEQGAAPVEDRFKAAMALRKKGWRVRIRIDPMIDGYDYGPVFKKVRALKPERVTLGTLRAESNLPKYVEPGLFEGLEAPADRKAMSRYPEKLRRSIYAGALRALKDICDMALCEETPDMWDALGLKKESKACNCGL